MRWATKIQTARPADDGDATAIQDSMMIVRQGYEVDLNALVGGVEDHLRRSWRQGVPLVLTIGGRPQILVETIEDLEIVQTLVAPGLRGAPPQAQDPRPDRA